MNNKLKIFIGWDSREAVAFDVCKYSIESRATIPVEIIKLDRRELIESGIYTRENDPLASTEFTYSRFFVPFLSNFSGQAVFCDCDFLWLCDAKEVLYQFDERYAVQVVQHDYWPTEQSKMDGKIQTNYPKKNWSSMILWNNEHPKNMTLVPQFLNQASGSTLHQFKWLKEKHIGNLPVKYNFLEDWNNRFEHGDPAIIHFTRGNVYFKDFQDVDYGEVWKREFESMSGQKWDKSMILDK